MTELRIHFRDELAQLEHRTLDGFDLVVAMLDQALQALAQRDANLARKVIADDDGIDELYLEVHDGVLSLMARQTPVASDLRFVAAILHVIRHVERMGDQCVTIAKLALDEMDVAPHAAILERIERMGMVAGQQVEGSREAFRRRDVALAEGLVRQDDELDRLNREIFRLALDIGDDRRAREWAMHMILVARSLERLGDNAVDIGEQTAFVVTGLFREFSDASHPERDITA
jgi:phosphate transport system protein